MGRALQCPCVLGKVLKKKKKTGSTVSVLFLGQAELALLKNPQAELEQGRFVKRGVE